ncbi:hypothetical protein ACFVVM_02515 [Nocardia sp. NPDC058176]|uniref:hypothetical protein n=1 Tax=Nocardia sp. NPDC058176 TaxID=3346368 RepID=UPI0036DA6D8E
MTAQGLSARRAAGIVAQSILGFVAGWLLYWGCGLAVLELEIRFPAIRLPYWTDTWLVPVAIPLALIGLLWVKLPNARTVWKSAIVGCLVAGMFFTWLLMSFALGHHALG